MDDAGTVEYSKQIWKRYFYNSENPNKSIGFKKSFEQLELSKKYIESNNNILLKPKDINTKLSVPNLISIKKFHLITRVSGFEKYAKKQFNQDCLKTKIVKDANNNMDYLYLPNFIKDNQFYHTFDSYTFNQIINKLDTLSDLSDYLNKRELFFTNCLSEGVEKEISNEFILMNKFKVTNNNRNILSQSRIVDDLVYYFAAHSSWEGYFLRNSNPIKIMEHRYVINILNDLNRYERDILSKMIIHSLNNKTNIVCSTSFITKSNYFPQVVCLNKEVDLIYFLNQNSQILKPLSYCDVFLLVIRESDSGYMFNLLNSQK